MITSFSPIARGRVYGARVCRAILFADSIIFAGLCVEFESLCRRFEFSPDGQQIAIADGRASVLRLYEDQLFQDHKWVV